MGNTISMPATYIVLIPGMLAAWVAMKKGWRYAFCFVFLPVLIATPTYYNFKMPGFPQQSFWTTAMLGILPFFFMDKKKGKLPFDVVGVIVLVYIFWIFNGERVAKTYKDGQNLLFNSMLGVWFPYMFGRYIAMESKVFGRTILTMALVAGFVGLATPYEGRMGANPYDTYIRRVWPFWVPWGASPWRAGIMRTAGPFAHPICAGFFYSMVLPLTMWLSTTRLNPATKMKKRMMWGGQSLGLLLTLSRGPISGAVIALWFGRLGWMKKMRTIFLIGIVCLYLALFYMLWSKLFSPDAPTRETAKTESEETVAYRKEMMDNYLELVEEHPMTGWGKNGFPFVKGQKSIDNQYLFLALQYGKPAPLFFLLAMLIPGICCVRRGLKEPPGSSMGRLSLCLGGICIAAIWTQITVFAGTQTEQILFLCIGFAVTINQRLKARQRGQQTPA